MNEETVLATEEASVPATEPAPAPTEVLSLDPVLETTAPETMEVILVDTIQTAATDLAHVNLFGSFLICGTLVGIFLLRNRHAN